MSSDHTIESFDERQIIFIDDLSSVDPKELTDLYESVGFSRPPSGSNDEQYMGRIFGDNVYGFFAFHIKPRRLIGAARVFSDDRMCSWLAEIIVSPAYQRKQIGLNLLGMINERFSHTALYTESFVGQEGFFEKAGIWPRDRLICCGRGPFVRKAKLADQLATTP